jgi:hypothetical protein
VCCLLVLDSVTSTPQWIRQPKPRDVKQFLDEAWVYRLTIINRTWEITGRVGRLLAHAHWPQVRKGLDWVRFEDHDLTVMQILFLGTRELAARTSVTSRQATNSYRNHGPMIYAKWLRGLQSQAAKPQTNSCRNHGLMIYAKAQIIDP